MDALRELLVILIVLLIALLSGAPSLSPLDGAP
jgi:hypothetical protein